MALILVPENGSGLPNANSYLSLAEADAYHEASIYGSVWVTYSLVEKIQAVMMATRTIDAYMLWKGTRLTLAQALGWPRVNMTDRDGLPIPSNVVPVFLKNATADFALQLKATNLTAEPGTKGIKALSVGPISLEFDPEDRTQALPESVRVVLEPYGITGVSSGIGVIELLRM